MQTYFFVDADGTEGVSNTPPKRMEIKDSKFWYVPSNEITELPRGTIQTLFLRQLTWDDDPIVINY